MIRNKKSFETSLELLQGLKSTLNHLLDSENKDSNFIKIQIDSTKSFINKISLEITEYENLSKEVVKISSKEITKFSDILIMARIAKGLTQKQLADKLEIAEQQIQRYEISDYEGASFVKMVDIAIAMNLDLKFESFMIAKGNLEDKFLGHKYDSYSKKIKNNTFNLVSI